MLTTAMVVSIVSNKSHPSLRIISFLLIAGVVAELTVNIIYYGFNYPAENYRFVYHIYVPLEYVIFSYYFYLRVEHNLLKSIIVKSIMVYLLLVIGGKLTGFEISNLPSWDYNLSGFLILLWALGTLFTLKPIAHTSIFKLPVFWVCLGVTIFYPGIFLYNGISASVDAEVKEVLRLVLVKGFNYVLYACFIVAFICSHQMKRSY